MKYNFLLSTILFINFNLSAQDEIILTESSIKVNGVDKKEIYFGFHEGDKIIFSFNEVNGKDLKKVEIKELESGSIYKEFGVKKLQNKEINISVTGIYKFIFVNSSLGKRVCRYSIKRIPSCDESVIFNSTVYWKELVDTTYNTVQENHLIRKEYIPKSIVPLSDFYINGGVNATFQGGSSRILIPVTLPENTVEWYYEFSAYRNKEDIAQVRKSFNLVGELTSVIDQTGALNIALEMLTKPPGGDICDIYLLDYENSLLFEAKQDYSYFLVGSRENIKSGIVKVDSGNDQTWYLGIKNPDSMNGINMAIEVVTVVLEEEWEIRDVEKMKVKKRREPYLKNE